MRSAWLIAAGFAACAAFTAPAARAQDAPSCPDSRLPPVAVPHARQTLAHNQQLLIVAFGSSSTQGWMASDAAHSYPAVLQDALTRELPRAHIAVINRGIGGQDATEEVARLETDVLAFHPSIVVWQVGANGALRDIDPAVFRKLVQAGIERLHAANADVILMDNQRSPRILAAPHHALIDQALADIAVHSNASLFPRGALMSAWAAEGAPYERFISPDGLHHNDLGYRCVGEALAETISAGLGPAVASR